MVIKCPHCENLFCRINPCRKAAALIHQKDLEKQKKIAEKAAKQKKEEKKRKIKEKRRVKADERRIRQIKQRRERVKLENFPPKGIEVIFRNLDTGVSELLGNAKGFGTCVFFEDGTRYEIEIMHDRKETGIKKQIAADVVIDGESVHLVPVLIGKKRVIGGFTDRRETKSEEFLQEDGNIVGSYRISETVRNFIAKKTQQTTSRRSRDSKIGRIEFYFYQTKMKSFSKNARPRLHERSKNVPSGGLSQVC